MDNTRRRTLRQAVSDLNTASAAVEAVCDRETDCLDNYPENLQGSLQYEKIENAVDSLNEAIEKIGEAVDCILAAI